jgi:hypothetical protein
MEKPNLTTTSVTLQAYVAPHVVPYSNDLSKVRTNGNAVLVTSQNLGSTLYNGPGAGRYPTAHSVVADLVRLLHHQAPASPFPLHIADYTIVSDYTSSFYIRLAAMLFPYPSQVMELFNKYKLEIQQTLALETQPEFYAFITKPTTRSNVQLFCEKIIVLASTTTSTDIPFVMPVLSS